MKIAIIGAGFSGLALCYYLSKLKIQPTLFDANKENTSAISSGLLHPYSGKHCRRTLFATECMLKSTELITEIEESLNKKISERSGILRAAILDSQLIDYKHASELYEDALWWDRERCLKEIPYLPALGGLFIKSGISVYTREYLEGLKIASQNLGAHFEIKEILDLTELSSFDVIIACTGSKTSKLFPSLPLSYVKGQIIELAWPNNIAPLPYSLVSNGYITMHPSKNSCYVGATYERGFQDSLPDLSATKELHERAKQLLPILKNAEVLSCKAGIRAFSPNNITPIIGRVSRSSAQSLWVFTALGSKGLLYHAYFAELLARAILTDTPEILPKEVRFRINSTLYI